MEKTQRKPPTRRGADKVRFKMRIDLALLGKMDALAESLRVSRSEVVSQALRAMLGKKVSFPFNKRG